MRSETNEEAKSVKFLSRNKNLSWDHHRAVAPATGRNHMLDWKTLLARAPELTHLKQSARAAKRQNADWHDFLFEHDGQITRLASTLPTTELRCQAMAIIESHLMQTWNRALDSPPSLLPWDGRPSFEVGATP